MKLSNQLKNLRVRTKLYLFLVIPLITMISLASITISEKYSKILNSKQNYQFTTIVFDLAELVHSLQKERGLSIGFVASMGKHFRDELNIQRKQSNEKLSQVKAHLEKYDPLKKFWGISDEFLHLLTKLEQLPEIRNQVDLTDKNNFDYYSSINTSAINISHHLKVKNKEPSLNHQSELFTVLLEIQEYSGQERGLLNEAFSQKKLILEKFKNIAASIALQQSSIEHYLSTSDTNHRAQLKELMAQPVETEIRTFRNSAFNKWQKNDLLNKLHSHIGYGGLIHDFKNYVIRGDTFYYDRFNTILNEAKLVLSQFRQIPGINSEELAHINTIETTFTRYHNLLDTVSRMRSNGDTIAMIDKAVRVDDPPALKAIEALRKNIITLDASSWWQTTTKRIELFKEISDALRDDLLQNIQQQQTSIKQTFYLYVTLILFVLTTTLLLAYHLINRLVGGTSQIASSMNKMHRTGEFGKLPIQGGNDEIGDIVNAFNNLIEKRDQSEKEQLKAQQQLLEAKKINSLYKLSGGVAHNFNNILATILGYASLAMAHKDVKDSEKVEGYLKCICNDAEKASALVEKIITYSQSSSAPSAPSIQTNKVLERLIEYQQQQLPTSINITHHIEADLPPIQIKQEHLELLFNSLVLNAKEAIDKEGTIEITLQTTTINGERCNICNKQVTGKYVELSIKDNGCGINDNMIEKIFEPFFTSKDVSEGAGMGLSMVSGLIRKYNGHIIVESTEGQGSKFRILLPPSTDKTLALSKKITY